MRATPSASLCASPLAAIFSIAPSAFSGEGGNEAAWVPHSMHELKQEVERWGGQYVPSFSVADIDAISGWLNGNFYKLTR